MEKSKKEAAAANDDKASNSFPALVSLSRSSPEESTGAVTHDDSLDPGHVLLREQVLLQPFKVLVRPGHMVFSRASQLCRGSSALSGAKLFPSV